MNRLLLKQNLLNPLKNERGVAALMGIVFGIIIIGTIAFNFLAESRQKQSGSVLTYTSTNAIMIAEAGLRFAQKCLLSTDATCNTFFPLSQTSTNWVGNIQGTTLNAVTFGEGQFTVSFPVNAGNGANNILAVSTGTYKGAQRSIQRFISSACPLGTSAATSCLGTVTTNNSSINPPPSGSATGVCPAGGPVGTSIPPTLPNTDDCHTDNCPNTNCPNFNANNHLNVNGFLTRNTFCNMNINGTTLARTSDTDVTGISDDTITIGENFRVRGQASLRISDDNAASTINSTILVYGTAVIRDGGSIRVNGSLALQAANTVVMRDASQFNVLQGNVADALIQAQGNVTIRNTSQFIGGLMSNGTVTIRNNGNVTGSLQAANVTLQNNAQLTFTPGTLPGGNTTGINQCTSGTTGPGWSE